MVSAQLSDLIAAWVSQVDTRAKGTRPKMMHYDSSDYKDILDGLSLDGRMLTCACIPEHHSFSRRPRQDPGVLSHSICSKSYPGIKSVSKQQTR